MKLIATIALVTLLSACSGSVGTNVFPGDEAKGDNNDSAPASFIELNVL